jgi:hypothetical protein
MINTKQQLISQYQEELSVTSAINSARYSRIASDGDRLFNKILAWYLMFAWLLNNTQTINTDCLFFNSTPCNNPLH